MWTPHNEAPSKNKNIAKQLKIGRVIAIFAHLRKIHRILKNLFFGPKLIFAVYAS